MLSDFWNGSLRFLFLSRRLEMPDLLRFGLNSTTIWRRAILKKKTKSSAGSTGAADLVRPSVRDGNKLVRRRLRPYSLPREILAHEIPDEGGLAHGVSARVKWVVVRD